MSTYNIPCSFLGYRTKVLPDVTQTLKKSDADIGKIQLKKDGVDLATVEVTGETAVIENRINKQVYKAERDITNIGGDASEVLARVSLLTRHPR